MADQRRSYYCTHQPSRRNWVLLFFWLLDTAIINSYLLSKDFRHKLAWEMIRSTQPKNNLRSYAEELPGPPLKKTKVTKTFVLNNERFVGSNHLPEKNAQFTSCRWCSWRAHLKLVKHKHNKAPKSNVWCKCCKVALCFNDKR